MAPKREKDYSPQIRDLVADGGTAGRAHDLIQATADSMPHELRRAQALPHYAAYRARKVQDAGGEEGVTLPKVPTLNLGEVAKNAGLDSVEDASIHGRDLDDSWVVYVAYDDLGAPFHGAYAYGEHGKSGKAKSHVSVAEAFAESEMGKRLVEQRQAAIAAGPQGRSRSSDAPESDDDVPLDE